MNVGDLIKVKEWQGFANAGRYAIVIGEGFNGWWDIVYVDGQRGSLMRHVVDVISEGRKDNLKKNKLFS